MVDGWFESLAEAERRARRRLPPAVFDALRGGSQRGLTVADNTAAFAEIGFAPRVAELPRRRELSTTVLGLPVALPVLLSPAGVQAVHPDGEVAAAAAAAARGTALGLSCFASRSIEDVTATGATTLFQLHWIGSRALIEHQLDRARSAGAAGLIVTWDWTFSDGRDWGSPRIPERVDTATVLRYAPQALRHPRWLAGFVRSRSLPELSVPNMAGPGLAAPGFFAAYRLWSQTPPPTWEDLSWLVRRWGGPVLLKGVVRADDARRAVDAGVGAVSVSNHGGNNLDGTPASLRRLPSVVDAVGDQIEVLLDGGVRRGSDVVTALALGARAVLIGRPWLWGLAVNGQAGVQNVLDILRGGVDATLLALGRSSVSELSPADLLLPPGWPARR